MKTEKTQKQKALSCFQLYLDSLSLQLFCGTLSPACWSHCLIVLYIIPLVVLPCLYASLSIFTWACYCQRLTFPISFFSFLNPIMSLPSCIIVPCLIDTSFLFFFFPSFPSFFLFSTPLCCLPYTVFLYIYTVLWAQLFFMPPSFYAYIEMICIPISVESISPEAASKI